MDLFEVQRCDARLDGAFGHGVGLLWGRSGTRLAVAGDEESRQEQQSTEAVAWPRRYADLVAEVATAAQSDGGARRRHERVTVWLVVQYE